MAESETAPVIRVSNRIAIHILAVVRKTLCRWKNYELLILAIVYLYQKILNTFYSFSAIDVTHKYGSKCAASMSMYNSKIVEIKSPNYPKNYANSVSVDLYICWLINLTLPYCDTFIDHFANLYLYHYFAA